uniref:cAMP-dependent protein kinase n=1 Tax=Florenciella parvula TaxID=236787 RepID=A0A7S2FJL0_9STRA|mmetsp:Transcript_17472/g.36574  ORF Transcript_17472/g.36574 Transcript_17472/m.36574 type:complete len:329 (+) Transcript_17472:59-1045(+)|eukprot:CAMPEP_0182527658 /NCGR_PEP_ID=MMETSP1323-20130603/3996_1 /TAXON_ID=236787 /ORGANISM="Florenciella parvula, Strain RCC1693" /LENGTH=328 /DNA_ID=CAMNT_0024736675 /DNA_START=37 /DNA_END=1023 /DNA_ORIENTATION=+
MAEVASDALSEHFPLDLASFNVGVTLGTGSFGRVKFATHKIKGSHWAIKMLKKSEVIRLQQVEHMVSEKTILAALSHPFIVTLAGTFQDPRYLYMVLEYVVGGEFFTHLRNAQRLDNNNAKFYAAQVSLIFEYLHSQDFIYRDLKPENLLLDKMGYIKITDFGFAKRVAFKTYTLCGTPEYIAPEVLLNKGHGKGVDWWTLGILMYEMLVGQPPFVDDDPMGIYQQILAGKVNFPRFIDRNAKSLIKKLLVADLTKRFGCLKAGASDIKNHKWYAGLDWSGLLDKELVAPVIPNVQDETDTSNFDPYPDSLEEAPLPVITGKDPFIEF